jgi:hypothetical protein
MRHRALLLALIVAVLTLSCGGDAEEASPPSTPTETRALIESFVTPTYRPAGDDRLQIPRLGLDVPFRVKPVPASGNLPDPDGPDDLVLYDFSSFSAQPALGGLPGSGNAVISGKFDSGSVPCRGGFSLPPCGGIFFDLKRLAAGDTVTVVWKQQTYAYKVVSLCLIERTSRSFDHVVARTDSESLTLLTSAGQFDPNARNYSHFLYVRTELKPDSLARDCPVGSTQPPPEPTQTPSPPADVTVVALPESVSTGAELTLAATTAPNKTCKMLVVSAEGRPVLEAAGMKADAQGTIAFKWTMPSSIKAGTYRLEVSCGGKPVLRELTVR